MANAWSGDTHPTAATGFPVLEGSDPDSDGVNDFLQSAGHQIITDGINNTDPTGTVGIGLPWDAQQIWRALVGPYPLLVGYNGSGSFAVGTGRCCPTHIGIGWEQGSYGEVGVGTDGFLCNDREAAFDPQYRAAVALAREEDPSTIVFNHLYQTPAGNPFDTFILQRPGNYNMWVGRKGRGKLAVSGGGVATIRHRLFVGCYETADDGGTAPFDFLADPYSPIALLMAITSVGDLETLVHGEGGVVSLVGATLNVTGLTKENSAPYPPEKTDGTTDENNFYNQFADRSESIAALALPSVIGRNGYLSMESSALRVAAGLINHGMIDIQGGEPSVISTPPLPLDPVPETSVVNERVIYIRSEGELIVNGDLENNGLVYLASGATLRVSGEISGTGEIRRAPCSPTSLDLTGDEINFRESAAVLTSAR